MIRAIQNGDKDKIHALIPLAIKEIRQIAKRQIYKSSLHNDLSVTTLLHDLYLKFERYVNKRETFLERSVNAQSADFYALCATTIKNLIYDHCRRNKSKTGKTDSLSDETKNFAWLSSKEEPMDIILSVKEALYLLKKQGFERQVKVIEYKYFVGFSDAEISKALGIGIAAVQRDKRSAERKLYVIFNPQVKEIYEKAVKIVNEEEKIRFIETSCGDDEILLKAVKLMAKL